MNVNSRLLSFELRIVITFAGFSGIFIYLTAFRTIAILKYFSVTATLVALLFYTYLTLKTAAELKYSGIKGVTMLDIKARGFVLGGVLASTILNLALAAKNTDLPTLEFSGVSFLILLGNILINCVFPLLVLLDWLLFTKKFRFRCREAFLWLLYPISFFTIHIIRNAVLPWSPSTYYFLDYNAMGIEGVLNNILVLCTIMLIANLLFVLLDTALGEPMVLFSWTEGEENSQEIG